MITKLRRPPPSCRENAARWVARPFFALIVALAHLLPRRWLERVAVRASAAVFALFPGLRSGLLANARHILGPDSTPRDRSLLARGVLRSFARFLVELTAPVENARRQDLLLESIGREHFEAASALGRGVIAVTLHMGNYELASMELASLWPNVAVVYNRERIAFLERLRSRRRRARQLEEIVIDDSPFFAIDVFNRLRSGGVILLSGDQVEARDGERFKFLHGVAPFSLWPARLALASGAPILPAFNVRTPEGGYRLQIEPPIVPVPGDDPTAILTRLVEVFERYVAAHSEQWLIIRPFWIAEEEQR